MFFSLLCDDVVIVNEATDASFCFDDLLDDETLEESFESDAFERSRAVSRHDYVLIEVKKLGLLSARRRLDEFFGG